MTISSRSRSAVTRRIRLRAARWRAALVVLAVMTCLPACDAAAPRRVAAPADTAAGEVPFRLEGAGGAALLVPVYINGEGPWDFVLDTGATFTCVERGVADGLALRERRGAVGVGVGIGGSGPVGLVAVDSMRIGNARAFDMTACVLDLQHFAQLGTEIHGLVGLNFLREFRVTLDFERNVVLLLESGS